MFGDEDTQLVHLSRYKVLKNVGRDIEAQDCLRIAYESVREQAASIDNGEARESFIVAFPLRSEIIQTFLANCETT
jgi:hypothetical protein